MPSGRHLIYWDANVFIAWLSDEQRAPAEMSGIADVAEAADAGKLTILTSVLTRTEVLDCHMPPDARRKLDLVFKRRHVQLIEVTLRVAERSHEIRNHYHSKGIKVTTIDALHLATAVLYGADEFHTFDGAGRKRRPNDLISLSGSIAGHPLLICPPHTDQPRLPLPSPAEALPPAAASAPRRPRGGSPSGQAERPSRP